MCNTRVFPWILLLFGLAIAGCNDGEAGSQRVNDLINIAPVDAAATLPYVYRITRDAWPRDATYAGETLPAWAHVDEKGRIVGTPSLDDAASEVDVVITATTDDKRVRARGTMRVRYPSAFEDDARTDYLQTSFDGHPRHYRQDLTHGDLQGTVYFVQTHAVAPRAEDNEHTVEDDETQSIYRPTIIALRTALLIFIPEPGIDPTTVDVIVHSRDAEPITLAMHPPAQLPKPGKMQQLTFSKRAWSVELPWNVVKNGLALRFVTDRNAPDEQMGTLAADAIDIDRATQLTFQSVRLGMLTYAPTDSPYFTLDDPILAATDYFQTVPVSKLIMGSYAPIELRRTIVNQGGKARIYDLDSPNPADHYSDTAGSIYAGDMRGDVAKSQVSVGIDLANMGVSSWDLSQSYPKTIKIITNHHAYGVYDCTGEENCPAEGYWRVQHGLSGGNGIGTITNTAGNEASHEWGHAYGLGHYPACGLTKDGRWARHNYQSGWGYIAYRKRMRSNVYGIANEGSAQLTCPGAEMAPLSAGDFMFSRDAMSGAGNDTASPFSNYTFYSSYSAMRIQRDLDSYLIADAESSTGYTAWNRTTGAFEDADRPELDGQPAPIVRQTGVPVATILGGYDPDVDAYGDPNAPRAVIYPVFYGNYGNIYDLPAPDLSDDNDHCWLDIQAYNGDHQQIEIEAQRHRAGGINQFHFNLPQNVRPQSAELQCRRGGVTTTLDSVVFDTEIPDLPPAAVVGQEHGDEQLTARELKDIQNAVERAGAGNLLTLPASFAQKVASYSDDTLQNGLPEDVWTALETYRQEQQAGRQLGALIAYLQTLNLDDQTRSARVHQYLKERGLANTTSLALEGDVLYGYSGPYADPETAFINTALDDARRLPVVAVNTQTPDTAAHWIMDAQGKLHITTRPSQCLKTTGGRGASLTTVTCDPGDPAQRWIYQTDDNTLHANNGNCVDTHSTQFFAETWTCNGHWNQRWSAPARSDARWLAILDGASIAKLWAATGH